MIFVDTSAWYASMIPTETHHRAAIDWLSRNSKLLLTTDYIADETLTLLRARGENERALITANDLFNQAIAQMYYLMEVDILEAWQVFRRYSDKDWSFTDCTCKVVIEKLGITHVFTFDQHFRQFGSIVVVP